jgi:hypothetical protein
MSQKLPQILPSAQPEIEESLAAHQATREFYHEVQTRTEFKRYCDWYYTTAESNRQELKKMRGELNIMGWFLRRK